MPLTTPVASSPVVDKDGFISREWYTFFSTLTQAMGGAVVVPDVPSVVNADPQRLLLFSDDAVAEEAQLVFSPPVTPIQSNQLQLFADDNPADTLTEALIGTNFNTQGNARYNTVTLSGALTPSTTAGIVGTTLGDSANAGSVGELLISLVTISQAMSTGVTMNVASLPLSKGDWEISGAVYIVASGTTAVASSGGGASTTSATLGGIGTYFYTSNPMPAGAQIIQAIPGQQINVSAPTTVFLVALATFSVSTCNAQGVLRARRVR